MTTEHQTSYHRTAKLIAYLRATEAMIQANEESEMIALASAYEKARLEAYTAIGEVPPTPTGMCND